MELTFDPKEIYKVNIDRVLPNEWNPKEVETEQYRHIVESIKIYGQDMPILVRELDDKFQVVDGMQRFTAMKELAFEEIWIYSKGKITETQAKAMTIWWQTQVPFDEIKLAPLVLELSKSNIQLPFSKIELANLIEMADFDFSQYDNKRPEFEDGVRTLQVKLSEPAYEVVMRAIEKARLEDDKMTEARAIELICADYLAGE